MRDQLVAAEAAITEQLFRLRNPLGSYRGPPDNRTIIATLEGQLAEIRDAIAREDRSD